jgi:hypothetical protein
VRGLAADGARQEVGREGLQVPGAQPVVDARGQELDVLPIEEARLTARFHLLVHAGLLSDASRGTLNMIFAC